MKQRRLTHKEKTELFTKYDSGKYTGADLAKEYPISLTADSKLSYTPCYTTFLNIKL